MAYLEKRIRKNSSVWIVRWEDERGRRPSKSFRTKGEASAFKAEIDAGIAGGSSAKFVDLCELFLKHCEARLERGSLQRSTVEQYRQHVDRIRLDKIADTKLHSLRASTVQKFIDRLEGDTSTALTRKIRTTMRGIAKYGLSRDFLRLDPVVATTVSRRPAATDAEDGGDRFPTKPELKSLIDVAERRRPHDAGYAMAVLQTLIFSGLRISELRGLTASAVTAGGTSPSLRVVQRADKWQKLGPPKSRTSRRTVPIGRGTAMALNEWIAARPTGDLDLVFPNGSGNVESYANIWNRFWVPICRDAGLADQVVRVRKDRNSGVRKQVLWWKPRIGPHALRHAYASILIENGNDLKRVSALMGHSKVATTLDLYGHLWVDDARDNEIANAAERLILGKSHDLSMA